MHRRGGACTDRDDNEHDHQGVELGDNGCAEGREDPLELAHPPEETNDSEGADQAKHADRQIEWAQEHQRDGNDYEVELSLTASRPPETPHQRAQKLWSSDCSDTSDGVDKLTRFQPLDKMA